MNPTETKQDPRYLRAKQATVTIMATDDRPLKRCLWSFFLSIILHIVCKWAIVPALVLAVVTGHGFFVKAVFMAAGLWYLSGLVAYRLHLKLNRLLAPYHLTV